MNPANFSNPLAPGYNPLNPLASSSLSASNANPLNPLGGPPKKAAAVNKPVQQSAELIKQLEPPTEFKNEYI